MSTTTYPATEQYVIALGHRHFVRRLDEGYLWWHDCPAVEHVSWGWIGRNGERESGHVITTHEPLTVEGSLLCPKCGDHGFIRESKWVPA